MENNNEHTVMILEDEIVLLEAIAKKFSLNDIKTISCTSGKQALDYLNNLIRLPSAIWLDYYLKDMNGLEFMQELKKNEAWAKIPVIVVSNSANNDKVKQMLALGASQYLLKAAVRLDDMVNNFKKILQIVK